ncbi:MAG: carboxypeptidase regulatory-like domain-containing protein, partial [Candidatus Jacksonbacteria bacterium]|nr:carboxypeptidase regulatory-like domain-containing protein [Candidatus Jacksonbacteria bacterium]
MTKTLIIAALLTLTGCFNSDNTDTVLPGDPIETQPIGRIGGFVEDLSGQPLSNVLVSTETEVAYTADDGSYTLENVSPGTDIVIKFTRTGYASNYEVVELISWETVTSNTSLMSIGGVATFNSTEASQVTLDDVTVDFQANSFIDGDSGNPYTGNVMVEITHVDPTTDELDAAP